MVVIKVAGTGNYICLFHGHDTILTQDNKLGNSTYQTLMERETAESVVKFIKGQKATRVDEYNPKPFSMNFYTLRDLKKHELIIEEADKQLSLF